MIILILLMFALIVGVVVFLIKSEEPKEVPPTQEEIDALLKEAEEFQYKEFIKQMSSVAIAIKDEKLDLAIFLKCADREYWETTGLEEKVYNISKWFHDRYLCRLTDDGRGFCVLYGMEYDDITNYFIAYLNPENRERLDALNKEVFEAFTKEDNAD